MSQEAFLIAVMMFDNAHICFLRLLMSAAVDRSGHASRQSGTYEKLRKRTSKKINESIRFGSRQYAMRRTSKIKKPHSYAAFLSHYFVSR
jgi:hypothetical protein